MNKQIDMSRPGAETPEHIAAVAGVRLRSEGVLSGAEIAWCRTNGVALGYDPVQIGWVPLACADDIDTPDAAFDTPGRGDDRRFEPPSPCRFRSWSLQDAETLARLLSSARLWRYLPERFAGPIDAAFARDLIRLGNGSGHQDVKAIEKDGDVVGQIRLLFDIDGRDRTQAEISYWLGEEHWGQGIASAAVAAFTAGSFRAHPLLERIVARVHRDNAASRRILEKVGYRLRRAAPEDGVWLFLDIAGPGSRLHSAQPAAGGAALR